MSISDLAIQVRVDTTKAAELSITALNISDSLMEELGKTLKLNPFGGDELGESVRQLIFKDYLIAYALTREVNSLTVTVFSVSKFEQEKETRLASKLLIAPLMLATQLVQSLFAK